MYLKETLLDIKWWYGSFEKKFRYSQIFVFWSSRRKNNLFHRNTKIRWAENFSNFHMGSWHTLEKPFQAVLAATTLNWKVLFVRKSMILCLTDAGTHQQIPEFKKYFLFLLLISKGSTISNLNKNHSNYEQITIVLRLIIYANFSS